MVHPAARLTLHRDDAAKPPAERTPNGNPIPNLSASPRLRANQKKKQKQNMRVDPIERITP
ncbi:hypothetical protein [Sphingomonas sanguinis]|uniref:hypothetical protein n=1 Tax=Sphingomonas sanguinis TaxID=33051 RepID=UPI00128F1505|nr:hypothetical protein [Sphingomonas sanguinis]